MSFLDSLGLLISPPSVPPLTLRGGKGGDTDKAEGALSAASPAASFVASAGLATKIPVGVSLTGLAAAGMVKWFAAERNKRQSSLTAITRLREADRQLTTQRLGHSDLRVDEKINATKLAAHNQELLDAIENLIRADKADTIEEAMAVIPAEHARLGKEFWKKPIVPAGWVVTLAREAKVVGINGGILEVPPQGYPKNCRLVVGPKGGFVKTVDGKTWRIMPSTKGHKIDLKNGVIVPSQLKEGRDYLVDSGFGKSPVKIDDKRGDYAGGHPDTFAPLVEEKRLKFEDPDLSALYRLETKAGLERMKNPADRRKELLAVAKQLRHRNGSYAIAAEILTGILKESACKTDDPVVKEAWEIYRSMTNAGGDWYRFSDAEVDGLADFAFDTVVTMPLFMGAAGAVKGALSGTRLATRLGAGVIGKEIAKEGVREGIKTIAAREGVKGLARMGTVDLAVLSASGATGDIAVQSAKSGLVGSDFHLKQAAWGGATYAGFHLGGAAWGQVAARLGLGPVLKGLGTVGTQTILDTSVGYLQEPGGDSPFAKRFLTSAIKMGGMHWGTAVVSGAGKISLPSTQGLRTYFGRLAVESPLTWMFLGAGGVAPVGPRSSGCIPGEPPRGSPQLRPVWSHEPARSFTDRPDGTLSLGNDCLLTREGDRWILRDTRDPSRVLVKYWQGVKPGDTVYRSLETKPLKVNNVVIEPGRPVEVQSGDRIDMGGRSFWFVFREPSPHALGSLNEPIQKASDFSDVARILRESGVDGLLQEVRKLEDCLAGRETTDVLSPLVAKRVRELMARHAEERGAHLSDKTPPELHYDSFLSTGTPEEQRYHAIRAALSLEERIGQARSVAQVRAAIQGSPLKTIRGIDRGSVIWILERYEAGKLPLQEVPVSFRQTVRDLAEVKIYSAQGKDGKGETGIVPLTAKEAATAATLAQKETSLYARLLSMTVKGLDGKSYSQEEIVERVRQVLERGVPLERLTREEGVREAVEQQMKEVIRASRDLYPNDWERTGDRNYFTGERLPKDVLEVQARYRFARMLLNSRTGRPIFGRPTKTEQKSLIEIAKLSGDTVTDYASAQATIRRHLERTSPEILNILRESNPRTRALVIESFFGISQHRQFSDPQAAFRLVRFLGQIGFYRELGVTLQRVGSVTCTNVSLGDMKSVAAEDHGLFFVLHTHPELYENGRKVAGGHSKATVLGGFDTPLRDTTDVLFSSQDVILFARDAKRIAEKIAADPAGDDGFSLIYDKAERVYRNWVVHPYGLSEIRIPLDLTGKPARVDILYVVSPEEGLNDGHRTQADRLRAEMPGELGIPVTVEQVERTGLSVPKTPEEVAPPPVIIPPAPPRRPRKLLGFFARLGLMAMGTGGLGAFVPATRKKPGPVGIILPPPYTGDVPPVPTIPRAPRLPWDIDILVRRTMGPQPEATTPDAEPLIAEPLPPPIETATWRPPVKKPAPEILPPPSLRIIEIPKGRTRAFLGREGWAHGVPVLQGLKIVVFQAPRVRNPHPMTPEAESLFGKLDRNVRSHRIPRKFRVRIKMLENIYLAAPPKTRQKIEQILETVNDIIGGARGAKSSREAYPVLATMRELLDGAIVKHMEASLSFWPETRRRSRGISQRR